MPISLKLAIQEIDIPWGRNLPFTGQLYAATPSHSKPKEMTDSAWCTNILNLAAERKKAYYVIPDSFWPEGEKGNAGTELLQSKFPCCIRFHDLNDGATTEGTPQYCIKEIIERLMDGEDIVILLATKHISGFLPALISMLAVPDCHLEKILWPIEHSLGYVLTPAQRGYLAGLYDANSLRAMGLASSIASSDN